MYQGGFLQQGFIRFVVSIGFCSFLFVAPQTAAAYEVSLEIEDVHYSFTNDTTLVVNWNTTIPAGTTAYLSKQTPPPPAEYSAISPRPKSLEHSVVFNNLVPHGTFRLSFSASTDGGQHANYEYPAIISVDGEVGVGINDNPEGIINPTTSEQSNYPFTLPGGAPTEFKGPFIYNCWGNLTLLWVFPEPADYTIKITDTNGRKVGDFLGSQRNLAVLSFTPPGQPLTSPWQADMQVFNTGAAYTATLAFEQPPSFQAATWQLTTTFTRPASVNEGCAADRPEDSQGAAAFLAQNGVQELENDGESFGSGTNSSFNGSNYANRSTQAGPARNEQLRSSSFGRFVRELFEGEINDAIAQSSTRADLMYWLFLALVIVALLNEIYFYTKRRRLWGIVYDARTKQPVELAVIRLFDQEHHKLLETRVTPKSGRYSFLAEPGVYYLEITKEGYHFPTRIVTQSIDNEYTNLYHGEIIHLRTGQSLIAPDIPIDTEAGDVARANFFRRNIFPILDKARLPSLLLALLLAGLVGLFVQLDMLEPSPLQQFLGMIIIILLLLEIFIVRRGRK